MSGGITVKEFKHIPGVNDAEYIKILEELNEINQRIINKAVAKIKMLSAQPETNCSEIPNNSDTISRQAVTKFLNDWLSCLFENCHKQSASDLKMIIKDFKNLPSVQPAQSEMIKEIRRWINSKNRGNADYFIVDKIEEIINKYE